MKIRRCNKCNGFILKETNKEMDYPFYCPECYENMYLFETSEDSIRIITAFCLWIKAVFTKMMQ